MDLRCSEASLWSSDVNPRQGERLLPLMLKDEIALADLGAIDCVIVSQDILRQVRVVGVRTGRVIAPITADDFHLQGARHDLAVVSVLDLRQLLVGSCRI